MNSIYSPEFNFVGKPIIPKDNAKVHFFREWEATWKNGKKVSCRTIRFAVAVENNIAFVDLFGQKTDTITYRNADKQIVEIPWEERNKPEVISSFYPQSRLYRAALGDDDLSFVSAYDMIGWIYQNLPNYDGNISVKGTWKRTQGTNGKWYDNFEIQRIYDAGKNKQRLLINADIWYNKDCIDSSLAKDEKRYIINGYIPNYVNEEKKTMMIAAPFIFDFSKVDMHNENHVQRFNWTNSFVQVKGKTYSHMNWVIRYQNGAEEKPFDESMLTETQRKSIEYGFNTIDDFKPKNNVLGERKTEMYLTVPDTQKCPDGVIDSGMTEKEFEQEIYYGMTEDTSKAKEEEPEKKAAGAEDEEDLF